MNGSMPEYTGSGFCAGFCAKIITPTESVPMNGYSSSADRMSTGAYGDICTIALAMTDSAGATAVVVSTDICTTTTAFCDELRDWAANALGLPRENLILSNIHQHSCVDVNSDLPSAKRYRAFLAEQMKAAIVGALEDRAPAEVYINAVRTEALTFVRHYWNNEGQLCGDNYGTKGSGLARHESDADDEMRLVKFLRPGRPELLLVNFQAHPHLGSGQKDTTVSANWPGVMRLELEEKTGARVIYFSGAGGNLNSHSRIPEENVSRDYVHHGQRAAQFALGAEGSYRRVSGEGVKAWEGVMTYGTDHSLDPLLPQAQYIHDLRINVSPAAAKEALKDYPQLHSIYHATAAVSKSKEGPTKQMPVSAIAVGDLLFAAVPYEMFDTNGMELRRGTLDNPNYRPEQQLPNPFAMTVVATKANGDNSYIPSRLGYTNGGYATDLTRFAAGTGEAVVGDILTAAQKLHG